MKTIRLSHFTYLALAEVATSPWSSTGARQPDGSWLVPIEGDTWERMDKLRLAGETDDTLVLRLIRDHQERKPS